ncbi:MAG: TonB-dependent siderophore receptor, partial [Aquincola sp.]|nr:TonB-dependent siderophore receptor [Aquincola sp.]
MKQPLRVFRLQAALACALPAVAGHAQTPTEPAQAVEVVGRTQSGAYHAAEAAGAKTELPLRELPQSVRVVTRQAIDDLGATKLDDVLDYV